MWRWLVTDAGADAPSTPPTRIEDAFRPIFISWLPHGQRLQPDGAKSTATRRRLLAAASRVREDDVTWSDDARPASARSMTP